MTDWWLTPEEFNLEYKLGVVRGEYPVIRKRGKDLSYELIGKSHEDIYKESIERLRRKIKGLIQGSLFIYPYSGTDTLTTFGENCVLVDRDEHNVLLKIAKKTVKNKPNNLSFVRADWNKPPFRENLAYNLISKAYYFDTEKIVEDRLNNLASQQLLPKSIMFFDWGYYAPLFRMLEGRKNTIEGYETVEIFAIRPEVRQHSRNSLGGERDTVIIYSRIDDGKG